MSEIVQTPPATRHEVVIGPYTIGDGHPVPVVAEIGVNHLGDLQLAMDMVSAAHEAGAHLIKLQTYVAEKRYDPVRNPKGKQFIEMLTEWQLTKDEEIRLWEHANRIGAVTFTSPFDPGSADFAQELGSVAFKLAAFEIVNLELVRAVAKHGKPVVFSRGMATDEEVDACIQTCQDFGAPVIVLHTVSSYPLQKKDSNLVMIRHLRERYAWPVGHSDHTAGTTIPPLAVAAGANMIEKHFTITPKRRESDNFFSITPEELEEIVFSVGQVERWMGSRATRIATEDYMYDFRRPTS